MGYNRPHISNIIFFQANTNPADSSTYLIGIPSAMSASSIFGRVHFNKVGRIRGAYVQWYNSTQDCTAEDTTISIRLNNTTDYTIYTGTFANAASPQRATNLNVPIAIGDYILLKILTPAWVTNPTGTWITANVEFEY